MRLIDADKIIFDYSGLVRIPPNDGYAIAKYFSDQIKAMPTITPPPNDPLTLEELREMDGEPVWIVRLDAPKKSRWYLIDGYNQERLLFRGECGGYVRWYEPEVGWMHFTKIGSIWHKEKPGLRRQAGSDALFYGAPRGDPKGLQNA